MRRRPELRFHFILPVSGFISGSDVLRKVIETLSVPRAPRSLALGKAVGTRSRSSPRLILFLVGAFVALVLASAAPEHTSPSTVALRPSVHPGFLSHPRPFADRPPVETWPTFEQNPQRTGENPNETILRAGIGNLSLHWTVATYGPNLGSVAAVNGTVYMGSWDGNVYAINASSGVVRWKTNTTGLDYTGCNAPGIDSTPAIWNGTLFVGGGRPDLYALDANNGSVLWTVDLANASGASAPWDAHKVWASPLVYNGSVYIGVASGCDNPLVRGQFFQVSVSSHSITHIFNAVPSGEVGGGIWGSAAVDPATNTVYITTGNEEFSSQVYARAILALNASNITQLRGYWHEGTPYADYDFGAGPILFHDAYGTGYVGAVNKDGNFYAFKRASLNKAGTATPAWSKTVDSGGEAISPAAFNGTVLFVASGGYYLPNGSSTAGTVWAVNPSNGSVLWHHDAPGAILAGLTYANGLVIDGVTDNSYGQGTVELLNASSGGVVTAYSQNGSISGEPIVADGQVIFGTGACYYGCAGTGYIDALWIPPRVAVSAVRDPARPDNEFDFNSSIVGGMTPYSFSWNFSDGTSYEHTANPEHTFATAGLHSVNLSVTDGGGVWNATVTVHSYLPLTVAGTVSSRVVPIGNVTWLNLTPMNGTGVYSYVWGGLPSSSCLGVTGPRVECLGTQGGRYTVNVTVTDSVNEVVPHVLGYFDVVGPLEYSIAATPSLGVAPAEVNFTSHPGSSLVPARFDWTFGDGGSGSGPNWVHLYLLPGTFNVSLSVTYPTGESVHANTTVRIVLPVTSNLSSQMVYVDTGSAVNLTVNASGGTGHYEYGWTGLPAGCYSQNAPSIRCRPLVAGAFSFVVNVSDLAVASGSVSYGIMLVAPAMATSASYNVVSGCGGDVILQAAGSWSGGTPPFEVAWQTSGGNLLASTSSLMLHLPQGALRTYLFEVTDATNVTKTTRLVLNVPDEPCASALGNGVPPWALDAGGAILVVVVSGVLVSILWRRRGGPEARNRENLEGSPVPS